MLRRAIKVRSIAGVTGLATRRVRPLSLGGFDHDYSKKSRHVKWSHEWINEEAEKLMSKAYLRHNSLGDRGHPLTSAPSKQDLEKLGTRYHYQAVTAGDKLAEASVKMLEPLVHAFFKDKYNHHAVVLETVAALPGMIGGAFRHMKSLRNMKRDNGWIHPLWEEAENERMHLLIWMSVVQPTAFEKFLVLCAQSIYGALYTGMYLLSPATAHRFVGYLEEEAVAAYTAFLGAIDKGQIPNVPAPKIARKYYNLPEDAKLRDVVLYVRADECMHRCLNHKFSELTRMGLSDQHPHYPRAEWFDAATPSSSSSASAAAPASASASAAAKH